MKLHFQFFLLKQLSLLEIIQRLLVVFLLLAPAAGLSQQVPNKDVKSQELTQEDLRIIQKRLHQANSIEMDFIMTRITGLRGSKTKRQGKALLMKPNKFKWMFETPIREYKLYDGQSFYDFDPVTQSAAKLATTGEMAEQIRQIVAVILDFDTLLKNYDLIAAQRLNQIVKVRLKPKTEKSFSEIGVSIDEKLLSVVGFSMVMQGKSSLDYEFKNPRRDQVKSGDFILPAQVKIKNVL